jgi:dTDP-4-amino-4,6-dideoxygalactose transaminase
MSLTRLAILGGEPAFKEPLHVGRPNLGDREVLFHYLNQVLERKWLTNNGPLVRELESRIAKILGVKNVVATVNGTLGLEIAIRALGLQGEVIVPSYTFAATVHSLFWLGIKPVFVDVDPVTYNVDPKQVRRVITPETSGIMSVNVYGRPSDIEQLSEIARDYNLKLLFDSAHAFHCSYRGKMIGNFGDAEVFSFHATKFFHTVEGGAVTTNDEQLAEKLRAMRDFGYVGLDQVEYVGTNAKMNEFSAAMGLTNLERLDEFVYVNHRNYRRYLKELDGLAGVTLMRYEETEKRNYGYIIIEVDPDVTGLTRDQLAKVLWAENILARKYFYPPCHLMEPYRTLLPQARSRLRETERISSRVLALPTGISIKEEDIETISSIIELAIRNADGLKNIR